MKNKWEPQWHLIEFEQCPRCYKSLSRDAGWAVMKCGCGFSISQVKYKKMIDELRTQRKEREKQKAELIRQSAPSDQEVIDEFKKRWQ